MGKSEGVKGSKLEGQAERATNPVGKTKPTQEHKHPQSVEEEMKHAGPIVCQFKRKQMVEEHPHGVGAIERRIGQEGASTVGERIPPGDFPAGVRLENGVLK